MEYQKLLVDTGEDLLEISRRATWIVGLPLLFAYLSYDNETSLVSNLDNMTIGALTGAITTYAVFQTPYIGRAMDIFGLFVGRTVELGIGVVSNPGKSVEKTMDILELTMERIFELGVGVVSNPRKSLEKILTGIGFPPRRRQ